MKKGGRRRVGGEKRSRRSEMKVEGSERREGEGKGGVKKRGEGRGRGGIIYIPA